MLPAAARLRRRAEFVATVRGGRRRGHGAVVVHFDPGHPDAHQADTPVRVGFVVSRAVGGAVLRNRVRRRLQHLMAARLGSLPGGAAVVVRALPAAAHRSFHDLDRDLDAALAAALRSAGAPGRPGGSRAGGAAGPLTDEVGPGIASAAAGGRSPGGAARSTVTRALLGPIVAYRRWVSPALPARCRFYPSCSAYAVQAVEIHGPLRGLVLTTRRLLRCHPFHPGGYDPVPPAPRRRTGATVSGAST